MSEVQHGKKREISVLNWLGTLFLASIPVVNLILFIVWAITSKRVSKRNFAIAALILIAVFIVLAVLAIAFFAPQILSFFQWVQGLLGTTPAAPAI